MISMENIYYLYVLRSLKTKWHYKGITDNLDRRLYQHMSGKSRSTKNYLPLELIHVEICNERNEARNKEKFFKSGYGREIISEIENLLG